MNATTVSDVRATVLPPVPPVLAARGLGLRPETDQDQEFLRTLYVSVRWEELAPADWTDDAKVGFLSQQFIFQTRHYKTHYAGAAWGIITDGGDPVGRLYLHQGPSDLRIVDISLLPSHRGRGIGAGFIRAVFAQGAAAGTGVSIHVEMFNHAARRLYERLGFVQTGDDTGVHRRMDWFPPST
ncbi:GNAT family N-acetyltransferase [Azospirillum sp. B506]|uniref:GNAT family N-acetyltransferase n=1 Tax=Azospirillum sp. B506 TaxID=137721 RepID=UPI00034DB814|nr:GNAT family N-acetyltransferase [Azospirillum sp. B506]